MKYLFSILTVFIFSFQHISAQCITANKVLEFTDSVVLSMITNKDLFKYFSVTEDSYYKYKPKVNSTKIKKARFSSKKKLKENVTEIWIHYYFNYPDIEGVRGYHWIAVNNKLELITYMLNFTFVPHFLIRNKPCNFLSKKEALEKSIQYFEDIGKGLKTPVLCYVAENYGYCYYIDNITDYVENKEIVYADIERIYIDAVTGNFFRREGMTKIKDIKR